MDGSPCYRAAWHAKKARSDRSGSRLLHFERARGEYSCVEKKTNSPHLTPAAHVQLQESPTSGTEGSKTWDGADREQHYIDRHLHSGVVCARADSMLKNCALLSMASTSRKANLTFIAREIDHMNESEPNRTCVFLQPSIATILLLPLMSIVESMHP